MGAVPILPDGQVEIPAELRDRYGLKPGDYVSFVENEGKLVLVRAPEEPILRAEGMLARDDGRSLTEVLLDEHARELECE